MCGALILETGVSLSMCRGVDTLSTPFKRLQDQCCTDGGSMPRLDRRTMTEETLGQIVAESAARVRSWTIRSPAKHRAPHAARKLAQSFAGTVSAAHIARRSLLRRLGGCAGRSSRTRPPRRRLAPAGAADAAGYRRSEAPAPRPCVMHGPDGGPRRKRRRT